MSESSAPNLDIVSGVAQWRAPVGSVLLSHVSSRCLDSDMREIYEIDGADGETSAILFELAKHANFERLHLV